MIAKLKLCPKYNNSGVEWLGEVQKLKEEIRRNLKGLRFDV